MNCILCRIVSHVISINMAILLGLPLLAQDFYDINASKGPGKTRKPEWVRHYHGYFKHDKNLIGTPKLESGSIKWQILHDVLIRGGANTHLWVEYIPERGPIIWAPSGLSVLNDSELKSEGISGFSFSIVGDIDGRGYRLWDKDRKIILGQEFFPEVPTNLKIQIESAQEDALVVHVAHSGVLRPIQVQWSVDGKHWSLDRQTVNHRMPRFGGRRGDPDPNDLRSSDLRIPAYILAENPHPFVEVDLMVGLTRFTRRFVYGKSPYPIENSEPRIPRLATHEAAMKEKAEHEAKEKRYWEEQVRKTPDEK